MITPAELAQQLRAEIERSTAALQHIAAMIDALEAGTVIAGSRPVPVFTTITDLKDRGSGDGQPTSQVGTDATQGR